MKRLLYVCLGNICRSPSAEGVTEHLLREMDLAEYLEVDSAGTGAWHVGNPADSRMRQAARRRGYDLTSRARQVTADELGEWDLVIAMDQSNLDDLRDLAGGAPEHVRLFSDFLPDGEPRDVPDPYYGGAEGFDRVLDLLERGCPRVIEHLLDEEER